MFECLLVTEECIDVWMKMKWLHRKISNIQQTSLLQMLWSGMATSPVVHKHDSHIVIKYHFRDLDLVEISVLSD